MKRNTIDSQLRARLESFATDLTELITQVAAEAVERGLDDPPPRRKLAPRREVVSARRRRAPAVKSTPTLSLDAYERMAIQRALAENQRDMAATARALGIGQSTLYRRIGVLGVGDATPEGDPLVAAGVAVSLDAYEKAALLKAIEFSGGDKVAAGKLLGLAKSSIYRRLRYHGVE